MYGREPRMPIDRALIPPSPYVIDQDSYVNELKELLASAFEITRQNLEKSQAMQKFQYDKTATKHKFAVGQLVLIHNPTVPVGKCAKFVHHWVGPYEILAVHGVNLWVRLAGKFRSKRREVHVNQCKPYHNDCQNYSSAGQGSNVNDASVNFSPNNNFSEHNNKITAHPNQGHRYNLRSRQIMRK